MQRLVWQRLLIRCFSEISRGSYNSYMSLPFLWRQFWLCDNQWGRLQRDPLVCSLDHSLSCLNGVHTPHLQFKKVKQDIKCSPQGEGIIFPKTWRALTLAFHYIPPVTLEIIHVNTVYVFFCRYLHLGILKCNIYLSINLVINLKFNMRNQITICVAGTLSPKNCVTVFCILLKCNMH